MENQGRPTLRLKNRSNPTTLSDNPVFQFVSKLINWRHMAIEVAAGKYDQGLVDSCAHLIRILEGAPQKTEYGAARFFVNNLDHICKLMPGHGAKNHQAFREGLISAHQWTLDKITEEIKKFGYTKNGPEEQQSSV